MTNSISEHFLGFYPHISSDEWKCLHCIMALTTSNS